MGFPPRAKVGALVVAPLPAAVSPTINLPSTPVGVAIVVKNGETRAYVPAKKP